MPAVNTTSLIRVSVSSAGVAGNRSSVAFDISEDGRYVLFYGTASNLAGTDSNGAYDVFLRDTVAGTTTLISAAPDGSVGNDYSYPGSVSADGRYVAFYSFASNLAEPDTNGNADVFVRDLWSGATFRLSQAADGTVGNGYSSSARISADGRAVVFSSSASNLVAGDGNGASDLFLYDMLSGTNQLVSVASDGSQGNAASVLADISDDSRYVVFQSDATNLVAGDTNGQTDIFLRDTVVGTTTRVSLGNGGTQANGNSARAQISADGRYVVFASDATNLVAGDTNGTTDIFLRDTVAGTTKLVSANTAGVIGSDYSPSADLSADGRYVVFLSSATNLVAGDTNGTADVFLRDTVAGTTTRLSVAWNGAEANGSATSAKISADGRHVIFTSFATNLVRGDVNSQDDAFRISLYATDAADRLIGSDGADSLSGLGGADILIGGLGADTLDGGSGNDTFIVDNLGDRVIEASGGGIDSVVTSVSYTLTAGQAIENLATDSPTGLAGLDLTGNAVANTITGDDGANVIDGGGGIDTLIGRYGSDTYIVDNAADKVVETIDAGTDTVQSSVDFTLPSYVEALILTGTDDIDATGNAGANTLTGNADDNILDGKVGADTMAGKGGDDTYVVDNGADKVIEADGGGTDTVRSSVGFSLAGQYIENLTLTGTSTIGGTGNGLSNRLVGNGKANRLDGGAGADILTGGGGSDSFAFTAALGSGVDRITDFSPSASGNDDSILLSGTVFGLSKGALKTTAFKDVGAAGATLDASDRIVYDRRTGFLAYDADGSGAGAAVRFAALDNKALLTAADFTVV